MNQTIATRRLLAALLWLASLNAGCAVIGVTGAVVGAGATAAGLAVDAVATGVKAGAAAGGLVIDAVVP